MDSPASPYSFAPPEPSSQGPSPTHLYSPSPDSPRSPHRDPSDKSPGYEGMFSFICFVIYSVILWLEIYFVLITLKFFKQREMVAC